MNIKKVILENAIKGLKIVLRSENPTRCPFDSCILCHKCFPRMKNIICFGLCDVKDYYSKSYFKKRLRKLIKELEGGIDV